jgi:DNA transformation protein
MKSKTISKRTTDDLRNLPNVGKVLTKELERIGIRTHADLRKIGSIKTLLKIRDACGTGCLSKLYALEGTIRKVRGYQLPAELKAELKTEFIKLFGNMR